MVTIVHSMKTAPTLLVATTDNPGIKAVQVVVVGEILDKLKVKFKSSMSITHAAWAMLHGPCKYVSEDVKACIIDDNGEQGKGHYLKYNFSS